MIFQGDVTDVNLYLNVPVLMYKGLAVNVFQFIILDMQTYTK